jgi:hypothetical protein
MNVTHNALCPSQKWGNDEQKREKVVQGLGHELEPSKWMQRAKEREEKQLARAFVRY